MVVNNEITNRHCRSGGDDAQHHGASRGPLTYLDPENVEPMIKISFLQFTITVMTKRSRSTRLYEVETDATESNRSMKHYFSPLEPFRTSGSNTALELFSPFDGTIYRVTDEGHDRLREQAGMDTVQCVS